MREKLSLIAPSGGGFTFNRRFATGVLEILRKLVFLLSARHFVLRLAVSTNPVSTRFVLRSAGPVAGTFAVVQRSGGG